MDETEHVAPVIGSWYKDATGGIFEVVAFDEEDRCVHIQYFDGALEEIDLDSWWEMPMETIEPPEDWSGSLDMEREDYGVDLGEIPVEAWSTPIDFIDRT